MKIGFLTYPHCPECGCANWKNDTCEFANTCYRETIIDKNARVMLEGMPSEWVEPDKFEYPSEPMRIVYPNKTLLKDIYEVLDDWGDGSLSYDEIGHMLSDYFMDALVEAHKKMKLETFMEMDSIDAIECKT